MVDHAILLRMLEAYKLQSWIKVSGQSCTFGHTPDANTTSLAQPRTPPPPFPYYYLQFLLIFNIVLGGEGEQ